MSNLAHNKMLACKFDYEYMGRNLDQLTETYGFPRELIQSEINRGEWSRKLDKLAMPQTRDVTEFAEELREITKAKLNVIVLMNQLENQAMISQLEKVCLQKAMELVAELNSNDTKAASQLKTLVSTINSLQERNPIQLAENVKDIGEDTKLVVQINNSV